MVELDVPKSRPQIVMMYLEMQSVELNGATNPVSLVVDGNKGRGAVDLISAHSEASATAADSGAQLVIDS